MQQHWSEEFHWKSTHYGTSRCCRTAFVESSCVKCHYEITDLVRDGTKIEHRCSSRATTWCATTLLRLSRDRGVKSGRQVGRTCASNPIHRRQHVPGRTSQSDRRPLNPPGTMRKVGPSVYRLAEKTNEDWVRHWVKAPRDFRPDTRMPALLLQPNQHARTAARRSEEIPRHGKSTRSLTILLIRAMRF